MGWKTCIGLQTMEHAVHLRVDNVLFHQQDIFFFLFDFSKGTWHNAHWNKCGHTVSPDSDSPKSQIQTFHQCERVFLISTVDGTIQCKQFIFSKNIAASAD